MDVLPSKFLLDENLAVRFASRFLFLMYLLCFV